MGLPNATKAILPPIILLVLIAWIVQLAGLFYLQKSCNARTAVSPWWAAATGAGLPSTNKCTKVYRYHWLAIWAELPLVLGLIGSLGGWIGAGYNVLQRYRIAWIGLLAVVTSLQIWSANVTLNLTDTTVRKAEGHDEALRALVAFIGFASLSALNIVLIFVLGDDGVGGAEGGHEPLIGGEA